MGGRNFNNARNRDSEIDSIVATFYFLGLHRFVLRNNVMIGTNLNTI